MEDTVGAVFGIVFFLVIIGILILTYAGMWKVFQKAERPGWAAIIPIYNIIVMIEIVGKPTWWIILCLIPYVNVVFQILIAIEMAKSFGKGSGFGIGLAILPFIFYPMLGFGDDTYQGPGGLGLEMNGQQGQGMEEEQF